MKRYDVSEKEFNKLNQMDRIEYMLRKENMLKKEPRQIVTVFSIASLFYDAFIIIMLLIIATYVSPQAQKYLWAKLILSFSIIFIFALKILILVMIVEIVVYVIKFSSWHKEMIKLKSNFFETKRKK